MNEAALKRLGVTNYSGLDYIKTDEELRRYADAMYDLGRQDALEEAAKVCDANAESECYEGAVLCAAAIRALMEPKP